MMGFLRAHHAAEDEGLYPAVRARRPHDASTLALLDRMDADHEQIAGSIDAVEAACSAYERSGASEARAQVLAAIGALSEVLLPHLQREEEQVMPVVSDAITEREWRALEDEHNVQGRRIAELGMEGHWLIDDASPADRAVVLGLVGPVLRVALLHGFSRPYRRQCEARWSGSGPAGGHRARVQKHGHTSVEVDAPPDAVWDVVVDITRVGEWSHECAGCTFVGDATRLQPGARFRGRNRQGIWRWDRVCEVVSTDGHELVWRTVSTALYPDSTEWRIRVTPHDGGTLLEQQFDVVRAPKLLDMAYARVVPAHRDRTAALTDDLRRLGELASRSGGQASSSGGPILDHASTGSPAATARGSQSRRRRPVR